MGEEEEPGPPPRPRLVEGSGRLPPGVDEMGRDGMRRQSLSLSFSSPFLGSHCGGVAAAAAVLLPVTVATPLLLLLLLLLLLPLHASRARSVACLCTSREREAAPAAARRAGVGVREGGDSRGEEWGSWLRRDTTCWGGLYVSV